MELLRGLLQAIDFLLNSYMLLLVLSSVLKLVRADESQALVRGLYAMTDPPARWLRRRFPRLVIASQDQYVDLSPFVFLLLIGVLKIMIPSVAMWLVDLLSS